MIHLILMFAMSLFATGHGSAQHVHPAGAPADQGGTSTLSADQVTQLLAGDGMGLAKAAELAGFPGPKHVLELEADLELTTDQRQRVTEVREAMLDEARRIGQAIVTGERELDDAFRSGRIANDVLRARVSDIARLQGELRAVHLSSHLAVRTLLTPEQVRRYAELRGHHR